MAGDQAVAVTDDLPMDLRKRRRLTTAAEINEAALQLFETKGVAATTVADIARSAGVSPRTFFRYFESKEMAAFRDLGYFDAIDDWAGGSDDGRDLFDSLLATLQGALEEMDRPDARDHLLRMRRLIRTDAGVRVASMRTSAAHTESLRKAISRRGGPALSDLQADVMSRIAGVVIDVATEAWEARCEAGEHPNLGTVFSDTCATVTKLMRR